MLWEHIVQDGRKVRCKFCQDEFVGGVTRMRYHFANTRSKDIRPCKAVPASVRDVALQAVRELEAKSRRHKVMSFPRSTDSSLGSILQSGAGSHDGQSGAVSLDGPQAYDSAPRPIRSLGRRMGKRAADKAIIKCMICNNLPFSLLRSPEFHDACTAIANAGPRYELPSSEMAWMKLLPELKDEADVYVQSVKQTWDRSGCTLMLDSWTEGRDMLYLNLFAACPKGVVYLKSLSVVGHTTNEQHIFNFVSSVIDEIGSQKVVQFISDNTPNFESVGRMIEERYPNIFKINCASFCVNLILKEMDTLEYVSPILEDSRKIVDFIYKFQQVLNLMKTHTNGRELKSSSATRSATNFMYLHSILKEELALQNMVATAEWMNLIQCKGLEGLEVQKVLQDDTFWAHGKEIMNAIEPLVKVLKMVDSDGSTLGYIYEAMHKAKEAIKEVFKGEDYKFMPFWRVIDDTWNNLLCGDIHAAAAYLNPHLFHDGHVKLDSEVKFGLEKVVQRMVSQNDERMKIAEELRDYHLLDPRIFGLMAVKSLHISHPRIWWDMWGSSVPALQSLAIKVLSQPCSFLSCKRNWTLDVPHMKKTDQLDPKRLQDLLYVRLNMHLMKTSKPRNNDSTPIDLDKIVAFPDDLEGFDLHEDWGIGEDKNVVEGEESEGDVGTKSDANCFSFSGTF